MQRIRRVESEQEMERLTDEFVTKGYKVEQRSQYSTKVKEKSWGKPPVHGFVFLFSLLAAAIVFAAAEVEGGAAIWVVAFLANVTYAIYSWFTSEEVLIKIEET